MSSLYLAYGSNLWHAQMAARCPGATLVATLSLPGWRLVVRKYALVVADPGARCPVALWRVTPEHMDALDRFEGHPDWYRRDRITLPGPVQDEAMAWIYHDVSDRPGPPPDEYVARLRHGYQDCGFDPAVLEAALVG
ncbi:MAG: gamma-glutamylcyclotransferase [Acetobacteraceae bacterium]|nr:gamma-glutamylcyclotransferase [Acetobacteraceae bacterium]